MTTADLSNPILNTPFDPPERYFVIGPRGPTGEVKEGRRPSESFIPVPQTRKGRKDEQQALDFDITGDRIEENSLINDIRRRVELWRAGNWNGVTPYSRKLLTHWSSLPPARDDPVFFCQREAAETVIFLAEVAGRHGTPDYRERLKEQNLIHNDGLPRVALKMATGSGKTVVMAMLIAWQTINKVYAPKDNRFSKQFLVVTPGITIRDRLGVLHPEREDNYYSERDLVPADLWDALLQAQIVITNYHTFLPRTAKEVQGVAANTRKLLLGGRQNKSADPFVETPDQIVARVLRPFGTQKGEIVVLNDEAHHCYADRLAENPDPESEKEDEERNADARVWFRGLQHIQRNSRSGIKAIYDLSATPYYLKGSGFNEGTIFPWAVSDFSLMDAIESGIVKVPRIPVDDDAAGKEVQYLDLWDHIDPPLPTRRSTKIPDPASQPLPPTLEGALLSLYRSYEASQKAYEQELAALGAPPPVMIVVCPNVTVSKWIFDWIAGYEKHDSDVLVPGNLGLFSNVEDGQWTRRQQTIVVDSAQLESGGQLKEEFRKDAAKEIEAFRQALRLRDPGADADVLSESDLLREVMNTIGKRGKLGEHVRCVVSVAMLTEGWDANTVTHILGIRPFRSQLLCEQVIGRGLRRRSYAADPDTRLFEPEYAEVYGVPFAFIPSDRPTPKPKLVRPAIEVRAEDDRAHLAITFPRVDGYRVEHGDDELVAEFTDESRWVLDLKVALRTESRGVVGEAVEVDLEKFRHARSQEVAFRLAKTLAERHFTAAADVERPWVFPQLLKASRQWLDGYLDLLDGVPVGTLLFSEIGAEAAEKIAQAIHRNQVHQFGGSKEPVLLPVFRRFDGEGSTEEVRFLTRKVVMDPPPIKSHLNHVVLDGARGNSWEEGLAQLLEQDKRVRSYVKNERLGFVIPYVHKGRSHEYIPDFLVRLEPRKQDDLERTLIVEVSGTLKDLVTAQAKAETARNQWCAAVNNNGGYGRWGYVEVHNPLIEKHILDAAIDALYADEPIIGLPH